LQIGYYWDLDFILIAILIHFGRPFPLRLALRPMDSLIDDFDFTDIPLCLAILPALGGDFLIDCSSSSSWI